MEAPPRAAPRRFASASISCLSMSLTLAVGCATQARPPDDPAAAPARDADSLLVVDCLLPGQLRRLGQIMAFVTPQRPIRTSASICEIRGGEYVAYDRANFATALKTWLPRAESGDAEAQTYVGEIYEKGLGLEPDLEVALEWYGRAAEQGFSRAQINLGFLYESGLGVERDLTRAMNYYRAASGFTEARLEYVTSIEAARREAEKEQLVDLQSQVSRLEAANAELERKQAGLSAREREVAELKARIAAQRERVIDSAADDRPAESAASDGRLAAALAEIAELDRNLERSRAEQQRLYGRLAEQNARTSEIRTRYATADAELGAARTAVRERERRIEALGERIAGLEAGTVSADGEPIAEQRARLESELAEERAEAARLRAELERARASQSAESREAERQLASAEASETALKRELDAQAERTGALQATLFEQERSYEEQLTELRGRVASLAADNTELESEVGGARDEQRRLLSRLRDAELEARDTDASAALELARLEGLLDEKERLIGAQRSEIGELQTEVAQTRARIDEPEIEQIMRVVNAGPAIEIIEPPTLLTRGKPVLSTLAGNARMNVIGRVGPVESLLSLQINGADGEVNENGIFKVAVNVREQESLRVVAVDDAGERTELEFELLGGEEASEPSPSAEPEPQPEPRAVGPAPLALGDYHALIIGNNEYEHLQDLRTAENDAIAVEKLLRTRYGFDTELLLNATRYDLLSALNRKRDELTDQDNLLIYYAGHGELAKSKGYWMPVDAEANNTSNWVANSSITDLVESMRAKHIMIVADSCYSGSLTRSSLTRLRNGMTGAQQRKWYETVAALKVRTVFTSGGVRPVIDGTPDSPHSLFATAFLDELGKASGVVQAYELFLKVHDRVETGAKRLSLRQSPQYSPIRFAGHESGEFLFVAGDEPAPSSTAPTDATAAVTSPGSPRS